jgi:phenylpropionate dioxygenase-like ring-hydroxylating dioxygenase large terminal subunit
MGKTTDRAALDQWYCIDDVDDITTAPRNTRLLGQDIVLRRDADDSILVNEVQPDGAYGAAVPVNERFGYAWATLGTPVRDILPIPETEEPDRKWVKCGAVNVRASGLRIVENFLDMAHFPYVHNEILGSERDTEVRHYNAEIRRDVDEVWATDCKFFQPQASMAAKDGIMTDYIYRVGSPFVVMLYKTCVIAANRWDVICLFVQPMEEDYCRAHPVMFLLDEGTPHATLVEFQQLIFMQDRIILENQRPRLLPLEPRAEIPTRADISSVAYRRWLKEKGLTFGTAEGARAS